MAREQPAPAGIAEHRVAERLVEHRRPGQRIGFDQTGSDGWKTFEQDRQHQQWRHRKQAGPHDIGKHVHLAARLGHEIAAGPAQCRGQDEHQTQRRDVAAAVGDDEAETGRGERQREPLKQVHTLGNEPHRQPDGEENLGLNHERGEPWRNAVLHRDVKQAELAGTDQDSIGGKMTPRNRRALEKEDSRQQGKRETQGREQQRRQMRERHLDDDEIAAPNRHHRDGEENMAKRKVGVFGGHRTYDLGPICRGKKRQKHNAASLIAEASRARPAG